MKSSTILAVISLAGVGAAQSLTSVAPSVTTVPTTFLPKPSTSSISSRGHKSKFSSSSCTTSEPSSTSEAVSVITTVVDSFVTICVEPTTFYVEDVCYTATTAYEPVTVTNCPCTVESTCTTPYVAPTGTSSCPVTGNLITSSAEAVAPTGKPAPPVVTPVVAASSAEAASNGEAASSAEAAEGTQYAEATQYASATSTAYVTAAGSKPTLMISLMGFLVSLPLIAALVL